jgi:dipeptidyl aminopeptidase/acylaminoacyl peptidase
MIYSILALLAGGVAGQAAPAPQASAITLNLPKSSLPTPTEPPHAVDPTIRELENRAELKFDDIFPRKSPFGQTATGLEWSPDERYLAYLWKPYGTRGGLDLFLYDTTTDKAQRITTIETFRRFDRRIHKAIERYKKDDEDEQKMLKMNDLDLREYRLKVKKENEDRKEPLPDYPGVSSVNWAPDSKSILFTYRGDIFRWTLGSDTPEPITQTADSEFQPRFTPDGQGFTFRRGGSIYRGRFNSPILEQLNPELPDRLQAADYVISPDGEKLVIRVSNWQPATRQVQYINYRERFAKAVTVNRGVADDEFKADFRVFVYDIAANRDLEKTDGKPWTAWEYKGGKEWQDVAIHPKPWTLDSKRFTFATWNGRTRDYELKVAHIDTKKVDTIYRTKLDGEHSTAGMSDPFFTPDGKNIVFMTDQTGWRQPFLADPINQTARPLVVGNYECYPVAVSPDSQTLFVTANKERLTHEDVYAVRINTGEMERKTQRTGRYTGLRVSDSGRRMATFYRAWDSPNELYVLNGRQERPVTDSHNRAGIRQMIVSQAQEFSYQNRHGQTVYGFKFLPDGYKKTDKRPLFLYVYGGPLGRGNRVEVGLFNTTDYLFAQYLTKVFGYVTATIDPRGSSGYGSAFGNANWERPGQAQVEDLADGVKYFQKEYNIDPTKVGINGWSFGGWQTQMCLFTAPDVFTLGIAGAGPTEWQNYNTWYTNNVIGASPNAKPEDLDRFSLTHLAKNLRGKLLLVHGVEDDNVLFQDTINVYRRLLQYGRGPLVELAIDPTGGHGMNGDMDSRDRHAIYLTFLQKHWGPYSSASNRLATRN